MSRSKTPRRIIVSFLSILILFTLTQTSFIGRSEVSNDVEIEVCMEDEVRVSLFRGEMELYSIEYRMFILKLDEKTHEIILAENEWEKEKVVKDEEAFPHTNVRLMTELKDGENFLGELSFDINIYSLGDMSETTFSFQLSSLDDLDGGSMDIDIVKEISTTGYIIDPPSSGSEYYKFYYQDGFEGYYSWNNEISFDGETSELKYWTQNQIGLVLQGGFEGDLEDVQEVSMEPLEIERTHVGTTAPIPEPLDHLPSFVIGLMIGSGIIIGLLAEKRREFYKKRDPEKVVKLEESYYYKGKN